jgi:hypothetical protein
VYLTNNKLPDEKMTISPTVVAAAHVGFTVLVTPHIRKFKLAPPNATL